MQEFLNQYGYLALMIGTFFEGEAAILFVSSLIHKGLFAFPFTVVSAFLGSFASDWIYYLIGRLNGIYFVAKRPKLQEKVSVFTNFFQRYKFQVLFSYRFLYGFRVVIPLVIGMSGLPPIKFLFYSVFTGLLWATTVCSVGYWTGVFFEIEPNTFQDNLIFVMLGFSAFGLTLGYSINKIIKMNSVNS